MRVTAHMAATAATARMAATARDMAPGTPPTTDMHTTPAITAHR